MKFSEATPNWAGLWSLGDGSHMKASSVHPLCRLTLPASPHLYYSAKRHRFSSSGRGDTETVGLTGWQCRWISPENELQCCANRPGSEMTCYHILFLSSEMSSFILGPNIRAVIMNRGSYLIMSWSEVTQIWGNMGGDKWRCPQCALVISSGGNSHDQLHHGPVENEIMPFFWTSAFMSLLQAKSLSSKLTPNSRKHQISKLPP